MFPWGSGLSGSPLGLRDQQGCSKRESTTMKAMIENDFVTMGAFTIVEIYLLVILNVEIFKIEKHIDVAMSPKPAWVVQGVISCCCGCLFSCATVGNFG